MFLEVIELFLDTPHDLKLITVVLDVIIVNVPALLVLDVQEYSELYADTFTNRLVNRAVAS